MSTAIVSRCPICMRREQILTVFFNRRQLALKVRPLLDNPDNLHPLEPLDNQAQIALLAAVDAADLCDAAIAKNVLLGGLHGVALVDRLVGMASVVNQQVAFRAERVGAEGHARDRDGGIGLCRGTDAVYLCENGRDIGAIGNRDLERGAGEHGEGRREGNEGEHRSACLGGAFAHHEVLTVSRKQWLGAR